MTLHCFICRRFAHMFHVNNVVVFRPLTPGEFLFVPLFPQYEQFNHKNRNEPQELSYNIARPGSRWSHVILLLFVRDRVNVLEFPFCLLGAITPPLN